VLFVAGSVARGVDDFRPLFDGETLDGWEGDSELWSVEDGMIAGSTEEKKLEHNSFLHTKEKYDNFVLRLKFKLRNGNSGVQFRSKAYDDHVVKGYQGDIADERYMGILYEEGGRGILADVDPEKVMPHLNEGEWNDYVITADGGHITQKLNGYTTIDYTETSDDGAKDGIIALQLHVGPKMRIWFTDVEIKELD
jgi:hypothetical protein